MNPRQLILKQLEKDYGEAQAANRKKRFEIRDWYMKRVEDSAGDLELIDQGSDHYQVMKLRSKRLSQEPPRPEN